jgi:hypothetical protein
LYRNITWQNLEGYISDIRRITAMKKIWSWLVTWGPRILIGLAAFALLWVLYPPAKLFLQYDWKHIHFPYPVDYGEGPLLDQVSRMAHFQNIYPPNLKQPPYTIANYPPLYVLVQVPFYWIFGPAYWYGRVISVLSVLSAAIFIILTLRTLTKDWAAAIGGGGLLLAFPYVMVWSSYCRVDSLALGLSWTALFVIARWPDSRRGLILCAILLTAAIYTRQSYGLAAPFAAFVWLLSRSPRKRAFQLAAWVGGLGVGIFLVFSLLTRGGFFFNIVTANVNRFYWPTVKDYARAIWTHMPYLVVSSGLFLLVAVEYRIRSWWLVGPYLVGAALSAITVGKDGSSINYMFELCAAFSVAAGAIVAMPGRRWWTRVVLILLLAWQVRSIYTWTQREFSNWSMDKIVTQRDEIYGLFLLVKDAPGPVLADEFMGLIPLAKKNLYFQPFELKQMVIGKVWDETPFLNDIRDKKFSYILLYNPEWDSRGARWTPAQLEAIESNYSLLTSRANTLIYVPNR